LHLFLFDRVISISRNHVFMIRGQAGGHNPVIILLWNNQLAQNNQQAAANYHQLATGTMDQLRLLRTRRTDFLK
jgi:hypothetical protein